MLPKHVRYQAALHPVGPTHHHKRRVIVYPTHAFLSSVFLQFFQLFSPAAARKFRDDFAALARYVYVGISGSGALHREDHPGAFPLRWNRKNERMLNMKTRLKFLPLMLAALLLVGAACSAGADGFAYAYAES